MNLYFVLSETLEDIVCEDWLVGACHREEYRIAELCVAETRGAAKYRVAQYRDVWPADISDLPKFRITKLAAGVDGPARIASREKGLQQYWAKT